jgi:hypothetical protein
MFEKLGRIVREYIFGLSILLMIIGVIVLIFGILGTWWKPFVTDTFRLSTDILVWSPYVLVLGLIVFGLGLWYLYSYINNKRIVAEGLKTNKRSEFVKSHTELKNAARRLPSRYLDQLKEKEKQFRIK